MSFDISTLKNYSDQLKNYRIIQLATQKVQIIPQVIPILEKGGMFLACSNLATIAKINYQKEELIAIRKQITEKKNNAQQAKNQQNRMLLKQYSIELGDIYFQQGDLVLAYENYFKAHENNSSQECLDYANSWVFCMIMTNQFMHYKVMNVNARESDIYGYQKWVLQSAIRNYIRMDYKNFLNDLLTIDNTYLESVDFVTCYQDLSKYFAIGCLITKLPKDIVEILQHPFVIRILDADPSVLETINYYIDYDFVKLIQKVQSMINELKNDLLSVNLIQSIQDKVINTLLKQYIINFKRMSLVSLSKLINLTPYQTQEMVERIIKTDNLNYVVDPIDMMVQEKYTSDQLELRQCKQFSQTVIKSIDSTYLKLLREIQQ